MTTQLKSTEQLPVTPALIQQAAEEVADPKKVIEDALDAYKSDPGAIFESSSLEAMRTLRGEDPAQYARYRAQAKQINKALNITELNRLTRPDGTADANMLTLLISMARTKCQLQHDADRRGVAVVQKNDHREVWLVRGTGFGNWLRAEYFSAHQEGVSDATLNTALNTIEAICVNLGASVEVHFRCAKKDNAYYLDLCDATWRAIKVDENGVEIVNNPPVLFTRNDNMRPLPEPLFGESLDRLWHYVNVTSAQRPLVVAWIMDSLRPDTPFPVFEIVGEQGSAKSSSHRHLRDLIDPNKVALRSAPQSTEDIFIAAASNWIVSYENLSKLAPQEQDALCTLATGGGFATRLFYSNGEEHVLQSKRPVMLNGITGVATRPDLIERTIRIEAPVIPPCARREETDIAAEWAVDQPKILGALLEQFSATLQVLPQTKLKDRQRMADFERLGEAYLRSRGLPAGEFSRLYSNEVKEGVGRALESFGIVHAIESLMSNSELNRGGWSGTVGDLLQALTLTSTTDRSQWPRTPKGLADQLRRLAPALREQGVKVDFGQRVGSGRTISLKLSPQANTENPDDAKDAPNPDSTASGITSPTALHLKK